MRFGLLGEKLGHSHSPRIYELLGLPGYGLYQVPSNQVEAFLRGFGPGGLNVTIPYKKTVLPLCTALSEQARRLGNVNTLLLDGAGRMEGHNTDYQGFLYMAKQAGISFAGEKVVILGTGGAAGTAALAARDSGAREVLHISRRGENGYENLARHGDAAVLVNATPVGMYPGGEGSPLSLEHFPALKGVLDLIYNPLRTRLLLEAQGRGLPCAGGLSMLCEQARAAAELYLGKRIPEEETRRVYDCLRAAVENIVLIGMPGSGKSTVGRELARQSGRAFLDTDELICQQTGSTPEQIILREGEDAFRKIESAALLRAAGETGVVLSTGGGAVLRGENRRALRQTGRVYWLKRPPERLETAGRPLSKNLDALLAARGPLYEQTAHVPVEAEGDPAEIAKKIWEEFHEHSGAQRAEPESFGHA